MTNKEARSVLNQTGVICISGKVEEWEKAQRLAYKALRENEELKRELSKYHEIEELAGYDIGEVVNGLSGEILRLKDEIEQLKAELEQSIKLPCKVGDIVYIIGTCKNFPPKLDGTMYDSHGGYGTATGYYCPYEDSDLCPFKELEDCSFAENELGVFEDVVCHICIEEDKMWYVCENSNGYETNDFGKTIFLTKEEAVKALKGMVK